MSRSQIWDGAAWVDLTGIPDLSVLDGRYLQLSGGQMAGNVDMQSGYTVFNLPNPANPGDATSKVWVESNFLALAGGQMTGPITSAGDIDLNPANELVVNIGGVDKFRVADTAAAFDVPLFVHATAQVYTGIGLYNESGGAANLRLEFAISPTSQATRWQNTWSSAGYMQWIYGAAGATDSYITLDGPGSRIWTEVPLDMRGGLIQGDWQYPTLLNGWQNFGSGEQVVRYRFENGGTTVRCEGVITGGNEVVNQRIFDVPAAYRPTGNLQFAIPSGDAYGQVKLLTDGGILFREGSSSWMGLTMTWALG